MRSDSAVIFVPGICGSALSCYVRSAGSHRYRRLQIWGQDVFKIAQSRLHKPDPLRWPYSLNADFVLCEIYRLASREELYGPFLDFCTNRTGLGLVEGETFFPFAYDWRADNRSSANSLARFIRSSPAVNGKRLRFIAHSMGGMVVRLLLNEHADLLSRTDMFFQIASPIGGSAAAFAALKGKPEITFLLRLLLCLHAKCKKDLDDTIITFPALYQLLPTSDKKVIAKLSPSGVSASPACDLSLWSTQQAEHLKAATTVHGLLAKPIPVKILCAYSRTIPTVIGYSCDANTGDLVLYKDRDEFSDPGDGTVTAESACRATDSNHCVPIDQADSLEQLDHIGLCRNPFLFKLVAEELFC
jgi:pimeloyl-ACP methyl ester carboxylesterase